MKPLNTNQPHRPLPELIYPALVFLLFTVPGMFTCQEDSRRITIGDNSPVIEIWQGSTAVNPGGQFDMGDVSLGAKQTVEFTIKNEGGKELTMAGDITISGTNAEEFSVTQPGIHTILPGQSTSFTLDLVSQNTGERTAVVSVPNNDPELFNFTFDVTANARSAGIELWQNLTRIYPGNVFDMGTTNKGETGVVQFRITNTGPGSLEINDGESLLTLSGNSRFSLANLPVVSSIVEGEMVTFDVHFSPELWGEETVTLRVKNSNFASDYQTMTLSATGYADSFTFTVVNADLVNNYKSNPSTAVELWAVTTLYETAGYTGEKVKLTNQGGGTFSGSITLSSPVGLRNLIIFDDAFTGTHPFGGTYNGAAGSSNHKGMKGDDAFSPCGGLGYQATGSAPAVPIANLVTGTGPSSYNLPLLNVYNNPTTLVAVNEVFEIQYQQRPGASLQTDYRYLRKNTYTFCNCSKTLTFAKHYTGSYPQPTAQGNANIDLTADLFGIYFDTASTGTGSGGWEVPAVCGPRTP